MELILIAVVGLVALVFILLLVNFFNLWLQAKVSGAPIGFLTLLFMRLRKVPPTLIVNNRITASKANIKISSNDLEAHYLSGGDVTNVVLALVAADKACLLYTSPSPRD